MLESECQMKPPSYGESVKPAGSVLRRSTSQVYILRACLRISEFTFTRNFPNYQPELPVCISSKEGCVAAVITSPTGKVIAGEETPDAPSKGILNIHYECSDKQTLLKIYDCLHLKQLENAAVPHIISNFFHGSSIKSFRRDEDAYFIEILVENPSFSGMRGLYGVFDCKPSQNHAYSLHVNYSHVDYPFLTTNTVQVAKQNPVSTLLVKGGQTLKYEILSKSKCSRTPPFTVVFSAENVEQLNAIKNFLVDPEFGSDAKSFEVSESTLYVTKSKRPNFHIPSIYDEPRIIFGDYETCSYELNCVIKFQCGSLAPSKVPPHILLCYVESKTQLYMKITDYSLRRKNFLNKQSWPIRNI